MIEFCLGVFSHLSQGFRIKLANIDENWDINQILFNTNAKIPYLESEMLQFCSYSWVNFNIIESVLL